MQTSREFRWHHRFPELWILRLLIKDQQPFAMHCTRTHTMRSDAEETGELDQGTLGFLGVCISFFFSEKFKKPNHPGGLYGPWFLAEVSSASKRPVLQLRSGTCCWAHWTTQYIKSPLKRMDKPICQKHFKRVISQIYGLDGTVPLLRISPTKDAIRLNRVFSRHRFES